MFNALASLAQRRGKRTVIIAAVFFVVAGALGGGVASKLAPYGDDDPATESVKASDRLDADGYRDPSVIVLFQNTSPTSKAGQQRIQGVERQLRADPDVARVTGYLETRSPDFVSHNGDATYLAVSLKPTDDKQQQDAAKRISDDLEGQPGVSVGGIALAQQQVNKQVEKDLRMAEMLAFPILFLLSLLFFRSAVAALLPLLIGGLAIVGTFLLLRLANEFVDVSIFALNLTTGLGLGLAIDYSLFVVSRYREEIAKVGPGAEAMKRTLNTAGRTVLFSSITVAVALASLMVFPQRFLYSMGLGGMLVALLAASIALTVLPAVLALLGHRVNAGAPSFLQRRAERDATVTRGGLLVPALALGHAQADPDRDGDRGDPDRARDPLLLAQVHLGGCTGAPRERQRPAGRQRDAGPVPALPRHAEPARGRARNAILPGDDQPRGLARQGHRGGAAAAAAGQRRRRDPGLLQPELHLRFEPQCGEGDSRPAGSGRLGAACRRCRRPLRRPATQPRSRTRRSPWRS